MVKVRVSRKRLVTGCLFLLAGLIFPHYLTVGDFGIYEDFYKALGQDEKLYLLFATIKLVVLNSIRGFPHYFGVFLIADALDVRFREKELRIYKSLLVCLLIPVVYLVIGIAYDIHYDFGIPAVLSLTSIVILNKIKFERIGMVKKALMVGTIFVAYQWLDIIPSLSGYGFGRGETTRDIKTIAAFMRMEDVLEVMGQIFFALFFALFLLLFVLILEERKRHQISRENQRSQQALLQTKMQVLENRTYRELQNLVHDLKTPLAVVQALVGVVGISEDPEKRREYILQIEESVERMDSMISELLHDDYQTVTLVSEILSAILSYISPAPYAPYIVVEEPTGEPYIVVNRVLFARAMINLIENAYHAISLPEGMINLKVEQREEWLAFVLEDNGSGMTQEELAIVWERGYSNRGSLGLGLSFVKQVVEQSGGKMTIDSERQKGTKVEVWVPAYRKEEQ